MAGEDKSQKKSDVYIVYTERTEESPELLESKHIDVLSSVLGSPEAAKDAIVYHYKHSVHGFSAKLTSEQAAALSDVPGVLQVQVSRTYQLHGGGGGPASTTGAHVVT